MFDWRKHYRRESLNNGFVPLEGYHLQTVAGEKTKIDWMIAVAGKNKRFLFIVQGVVMKKYEDINLSQLVWMIEYHTSLFARSVFQVREDTILRHRVVAA